MSSYTNVFGGSVVVSVDTAYRAFTIAADTQLYWPTQSNSNSNVATPIMDVTASSGSLKLKMPDATQVSVGMACLVNNVGSNTFTVTDTSGNTLCSVASGQVWQVYVTSNATANGTWRSYQYGAGTSSNNAATLAGPGLTAIGSQLEQIVTVQTTNTTPYTISTASISKAIVWTGAAGTFTLDSAGTVGASWFCHIKNGGSGTLTVNTTGGNTIDGASSVALQPNDSFIVICDGSTFYTVGKGQNAAYAFTYLSINVAGSGVYTLNSTEYSKTALKFTGALTGNRQIAVPATTQQYWVNNATSGAFTLTVQVTGAPGATVDVQQGSTMILYSDGTNVVNASSGGIATPISVANGGTGSTTASGARTNLGATATGDAVFTAASQAAARTAIGAAPLASPLFTPNVGVGAVSPDAAFYVSGNTLATTTPLANTLTHFVGADATPPRMLFDSYGGVNNLSFRRANGTSAAMTALAADDTIVQFGGWGRGTTTYAGPRASILFNASEAWTDSANGTYITFSTTTNGAATNTERMRIDNAGNVGIGVTPVSGTTSILQVSSDLTLYGASRGFLGNIYYNGAWRYAGTGYGWGWIDSGSGNITFQSTSASGSAGGAATLAERLRIDASGNVGIGGTPSYKLDVIEAANDVAGRVIATGAGKAGTFYIQSQGANANLYLTSNGGSGRSYALYSDTSGGFNLYDGTTNRLQVTTTATVWNYATTADMNVVAGSGTASILVQGSGTNVAYLRFANTTNGERVRFTVDNSRNTYLSYDSGTTSHFQFQSNGNFTAWSGIYTDSRLNTVGYTGLIGGGATVSGYLAAYTAAGTRKGYTGFFEGTNYIAGMTDGAVPLQLGTNGSVRMTMDASGNTYFSEAIQTADGGGTGAVTLSKTGSIELWNNSGPFIDFKNASIDDYDVRIQQSGASDLFFLQAAGGGSYQFKSPTNSVIYAMGQGGWGGFNAAGSGTNSGYLFFSNGGGATEHARIEGNNVNQMLFYTGTAATLRMVVESGLQVGTPTGGDKGAGTINAASGIYDNGTRVSTGFTLGTAVSAASQTSIDFTSIPSGVRKITVTFNGLSSSGTSSILVRLGSGSVQTTGYTSYTTRVSGSSVAGPVTSTDGMYVDGLSISAADAMSGAMEFTLQNSSNTWVATGQFVQTNNTLQNWMAGIVTLGGTLDRLRITMANGTDTFDAGSVNIVYQ